MSVLGHAALERPSGCEILETMDVDHILQTFATHAVDALLIGGMIFLLRHEPVLTYDVDLWIPMSLPISAGARPR